MNTHQLISDALQKSVEEAFCSTIAVIPAKLNEDVLGKIADGLICSIAVTGPLSGDLSLCLSKKSACSVVSKMLATEVEEGSVDVSDGIGEIVNIIVGGIKNKISGTGFSYTLTTPQIKSYQDLKIGEREGVVVLECNYSYDDIVFKIIFDYTVSEIEEKKDDATSKATLDAIALLGTLGAQVSKPTEEVSKAVAEDATLSKTDQKEDSSGSDKVGQAKYRLNEALKKFKEMGKTSSS